MMFFTQRVMLFFACIALCSMLLFILFGENGLADLNLLKNERNIVIERNESLAMDNLVLFSDIERLKNDPDFIESVARQELGMIGKDELIIKPQR